MQALISIIIPTYNCAQYIKECIDSVIQQTYTNWECIIVDNASTDNTKSIIEAYLSKHANIKYYYTDIKGVSHARNYGIQKSSGEYILPLDADDKIQHTYIEKAVKVHTANPALKVVYANAAFFDLINKEWLLPEYSYKNLLIENTIYCSAVFKREDYNKTAGYNEQMVEGFEDWDFWLSFLKDSDAVYKIPEVLFYYRVRKTSRNNSLDDSLQRKLRKQILNNHKQAYEKYILNSEFVYDYYLLNKQYEKVRSSKSYKIGLMITKPLNIFLSLFKKT